MDENNNSGFGEVTERETPENNETEDTQDEQVGNDSNGSQDNDSDQADDQQGEEGNEENNGEENNSQEPTRKTEKGTKLDPNPKSAVHQQLANANRIRSQYEQVLSDPAKIAQFVKQQYGIDMQVPGAQPKADANGNQQPAPITSGKKFTAKDFENIEDVANVVNQIQEQFQTTIAERDAKIEQLTKQVTGIQQGGRIQHVANNLAADVTELRSLPELNPESPDFIPGLEDRIGAYYHKLDFDEASGMYRGDYSLKEIAQEFLETARVSRQAGSKRAQTIIKDKTGGAVRTTPGGGKQVNSDQLSPGSSIAAGIAKMFPRG